MAGLVLDSSIALSWCLPDEAAPDVDEVQQTVVMQAAVVAAHWPLEVANALLMAVRRGRIDVAFRDAALRDLAALPIALDPERPRAERGARRCVSPRRIASQLMTQPTSSWRIGATCRSPRSTATSVPLREELGVILVGA